MKRKRLILCLFAVCLLALAFPIQAAAANPILVVTSASNPYTTFLPEILRTEGFNEFDTADISIVTSASLSAYDLAVLGDMSLTASQVTMFTNWVNGGGNLVAMHPDKQLAGLLGLTTTTSTLSDAYLLMNTSLGPGAGLVGQTIQFHGPADLYTLNTATSYATLYSNASTPTTNPAVTLNHSGSGQAAAFTYDLARSVAYTRQGNPAWSGQARDGQTLIRSDDLYFGGSQPDYVDFNKIQIPQADEHQRLFANLLQLVNVGKKPLPHFWYFPKMFKAVVIMTGDDHGVYYSGGATAARFNQYIAASPTGCNVANWECVRSTSYLFPPVIASNPLTNAQAVSFVGQGFEIGVHNDSNPTCVNWTLSELNSYYTTNINSWASKYTGVPAPQTHRQHCIAWSDYDSQPQAELAHGIRLDTSYYYWPDTWIQDRPGLFTGSGMPMRYTTRTGNVLDIYQAVTQMTDESGQSYPLHINTLLDDALSGAGYYGAFTANMHTDVAQSDGSDAIINSAKARSVPVVSSLQMLQWLDGRNASSFGSMAWSGNVLSFTVAVGANANNLRALLPTNFGTLGLSSLLRSGSAISYQLQTIKGVQYAVFVATAGSYQATYGGAPLFSISGAITPGAGANGSTVTATGPVTVSATADSYGNYSLTGLPSGTYTVTPSRTGATFNPPNQSVTISGANVAAVNFAQVQTCPCSLWNNNTVPGTPLVNDNTAYEFGVRFRSDVAGTITGIRFYKSSQNTGTHTGTLWSNTGTQLATATFTGETASGWQQVNFSTPVSITANTTYVASYHTTTGFYAEDDGYFVTSYDNAPLHGVQDGTSSGNGVYKPGASGFPNNRWLQANYWVDVVFSPAITTYSLSGTISGPGGAGATVTRTGTSSGSTTADASGNYTFTGLANGSYTVTPSKTGFTYTPANQPVTISGVNVTGVNFSTVTYSLSGAVSGLGGNGATVTLSGAASATTTADASGNYTFAGLTNGSYTVTPSKTGFTFTPASTTTTLSNASLTGVNFATVTYTISGAISGTGGNAATVTLSGAASGTTTADGSGNFTITGVAPGSYTVTPSKSGFSFTPASLNVSVTNANVTAVNFTTTVQTYTLQGTISGTGGSGATVTLSGTSGGSVTADTSGNYTFTGLTNGPYTVTPSKTGFSFSPGSQAVTVNGANLTGVNFSSFQTCPCSLWTSSTVPGTPAANDTSAVEVGVRFTSDVAGFITGLQFYKGATNTGTHIGNLWTNTGTLLASATFANESASGWQQVSFGSPVAIAANTTYVASYHTDTGNYSLDQNYFATTAFNNPPLHGLQDVSTAHNGVYTYGASAFPTSTFASANYYVDVTFTTAGAYSVSGTISGTGGSGATVTLTGTSTAVVTADASGNYSFTGLTNGTYTVTPGKTGFNFSPASQNATVNNASVAALNFSTVTYSISGTISGAGGANATVSLSGASSATTTADGSGNYSFSGLANGGYTVTPSKTGFSYTPTSQGVTISNVSATAVNFTSASIPTFTVSGTISGAVVSGVTVQLNGAASATATTNASGAYSFTVAAGSYTVTPSSAGFVFTPPSQPANVTTTNVTGLNFTSAVQTFTLQGTISGTGGSGATVTLSGAAGGTTTADTSGNYTFSGLTNGSYTVTPSKTGFSFGPASQAATVSGANVTGVNFSSFASCPCSLWPSTTTPGNLANDPNPTELGVRFSSDVAGFITGIRFYKGATNTGTHIGNLWSNTGTLMATATFGAETASGWQQVSFATPVPIAANTMYVASYHTDAGNYSYDQNYFTSAFNAPPLHAAQDGASGANGVYQYGATAFPTSTFLSSNYYVDVIFTTSESISGTISGPGGAGATVNLTGAATASVTADASGNYTFTGLTNGSYTVTPSKTGFTFTPANQAVTLNNANATAVNFSTVTYTISGTISGTGGNGATVNLTGAATATVTANASGAYTFTGLTNGSYTVTPSKAGFTMTPASQNVTVNSANLTGVNFSSAVITYSITGTLSMPGGNGVTMSLTGTSTATVTSDASGNYSFTGLANGSYTVTPTKTGYTFNPTSLPATINNANVTAINFTTISYSISGTISGAGGNAATVNLTGAATATVTADASGNFTFTGLGNGAYTITPSKSGFSFTPASQAVTVSSANLTGVSFSSAVATTFSISGTISGSGGNAATVTLSGAASASTTADASGNFTFSNLNNGSYTVTPSKTGYIFTPVNKAVTVSGTSVTAVNFTSTAQLVIDKTASTDRGTAATTLASAAFTTTSTNELLLAFVSSDANSAGITVTGMTGGSLTWTLVKRTNTQLGTSEIWRAFAPAILTNATVTATLSQSVAASITVVTFSGVDTTGTGGSGAIGATGGNNAATGAPTASLATTRNNSWVIGVGNDYDNATNRTVGTNQTMVHQYLSPTGDTFWVQRQTSTTPASGTVVTINDTAPTADRFNLSICEVLPAP